MPNKVELKWRIQTDTVSWFRWVFIWFFLPVRHLTAWICWLLVHFLPVYRILQFNKALWSWICSVREHVTSQWDSSQSFSRFLLPFWYWSTVCFRSLFEQNISCCTGLKCLALWSKLSPIICLYLAPLDAPFILVCAEKPADTTLLSQPFFKVVMVISGDCFLADARLTLWLISSNIHLISA